MQAAIEAEIRGGNLIRAHEMCVAALAETPDDVALQHAAVICLLRSGAIDRAREAFREFRLDQCDLNEDFMVLDARLAKAQAFEAGRSDFSAYALRSAQRYGDVFDVTGGAYSGVNAASMMALCGQLEKARGYAREVLARALPGEGSRQARYYAMASLAEAHLVLGNSREARIALDAAIAEDPENYGAQAVTRKQLLQVGEALGYPSETLALPDLPRPFHYAGHIFRDDAEVLVETKPGLPLAARLDKTLDDTDAGPAFGALAAGSDLLVAEAALRRGVPLTVVLPVPIPVFMDSSVRHFGRAWESRCENCLEQAADIIEASSDRMLLSAASINLASSIAMGLARLRAEMLGTEPFQLLLLDPDETPGDFGTAHDGRMWREAGLDQRELRIQRPRQGPGAQPPMNASAKAYKPVMRAMLFADIVGSSKVPEDLVPGFVENVLRPLAECSANAGACYQDSWGDGVFLAFKTPLQAARAATDLQACFRQIGLQDLGLPADLDIRIGVHYGPAHLGADPLMKRDSLFGSQVSLASRIENAAMPGTVCASEAFAAVLAMEQSGDYRCEPVGVRRVDREAAPVRLYALRRVAVDSLTAQSFRRSHRVLETS